MHFWLLIKMIFPPLIDPKLKKREKAREGEMYSTKLFKYTWIEKKRNATPTNFNRIPITLKYAKTATGTKLEGIVQKLANYRVLNMAYFIFHFYFSMRSHSRTHTRTHTHTVVSLELLFHRPNQWTNEQMSERTDKFDRILFRIICINDFSPNLGAATRASDIAIEYVYIPYIWIIIKCQKRTWRVYQRTYLCVCEFVWAYPRKFN